MKRYDPNFNDWSETDSCCSCSYPVLREDYRHGKRFGINRLLKPYTNSPQVDNFLWWCRSTEVMDYLETSSSDPEPTDVAYDEDFRTWLDRMYEEFRYVDTFAHVRHLGSTGMPFGVFRKMREKFPHGLEYGYGYSGAEYSFVHVREVLAKNPGIITDDWTIVRIEATCSGRKVYPYVTMFKDPQMAVAIRLSLPTHE